MKIYLHSGNGSGAAIPVRGAKWHLIGGATRSTTSSAGSCHLLSWVGGCFFTCEVAVFEGKKTSLWGASLVFVLVCWWWSIFSPSWNWSNGTLRTSRLIILSVFIRWIGESRIRSKFVQNTDLPFFLICFFHQTPFDDASTLVWHIWEPVNLTRVFAQKMGWT